MARGRKPKDERLHELAGNPGKRKRAPKADEPTPAEPLGEYDPPPHLHAKVREVWRRELQRFRDAGYGRPSDLAAFGLLCTTMYRHERALAVVLTKGETYQTNTGNLRKRPEADLATSLSRQILQLMRSLTLTTDARHRAAAALAARQPSLPFDHPSGADTPAPQPDPSHGAADPIGYLHQPGRA